jgi:hypothetical protein
MSQLGGWALMDYAINHADNASDVLPIAYGSYLSSFANILTDPMGVNPNDGAGRWVFHVLGPDNWELFDGEIGLGVYGALCTAASVIDDDDIFGLLGYGCDVTLRSEQYAITPKDGVRKRIYAPNLDFQMALDRDRFAATPDSIRISQAKDLVEFVLENAIIGAPHSAGLRLEGLPEGSYEVRIDNAPRESLDVGIDGLAEMDLDIGSEAYYQISIEKSSAQ